MNLRSEISDAHSHDRLTKERRSWNMSRIRGKNTTPEIIVRRLLHKMGYRFRLHVKIPIEVRNARSGVRTQKKRSVFRLSPFSLRNVSVDIILPKYKTAIFVHGCFWHRHKGCKNCTTPTHRQEFWLKKLNGNAERDKLNQRALRKLGWKVIVIWECQTKEDASNRRTMDRLLKRLIRLDDARALSNP